MKRPVKKLSRKKVAVRDLESSPSEDVTGGATYTLFSPEGLPIRSASDTTQQTLEKKK